MVCCKGALHTFKDALSVDTYIQGLYPAVKFLIKLFFLSEIFSLYLRLFLFIVLIKPVFLVLICLLELLGLAGDGNTVAGSFLLRRGLFDLIGIFRGIFVNTWLSLDSSQYIYAGSCGQHFCVPLVIYISMLLFYYSNSAYKIPFFEDNAICKECQYYWFSTNY